MDKVGISSNNNNKIEYAVSYSEGKVNTDQFYLENKNDFKSPKIVKKLPKRKEIRGKIQTVDEVNFKFYN